MNDLLSGNARAAIVNRTHRVVRERAAAMDARRRRIRSLLLPLVICSAMFWLVCHSIWSTIGQTIAGLEDETGRLLNGQISDTSNTLYLLLIWFLPVGVLTLAVLVMRRMRSERGGEGMLP